MMRMGMIMRRKWQLSEEENRKGNESRQMVKGGKKGSEMKTTEMVTIMYIYMYRYWRHLNVKIGQKTKDEVIIINVILH
uniref:Uncharacterized protein n=1 Tax=Tetranychus urticae TaxID=32264 RepID=T1KW19_TETUR